MLQLDRTMGAFITLASFRGVDMNVSFETTDLGKLKELIRQAKPLWKKRQAWFTHWRKTLWGHYKRVLADNWWNEDKELTETKFYRHLEWPVGVEFLCKQETNEFNYRLGGWSEELYSDHGVDAFGKTIDEMEVVF